MKTTLTKIEAFEILSSDGYHDKSEGIYKSKHLAEIEAFEHPQGWGKDRVNKKEIWINKDQELFELKLIGKFRDESKKEKNEMLDHLRKKLTPSELNYLGIKPI